MNDNMEVNKDQVNSAVDALKKFAEKQKDDFLGANKKIFLQLGFKKTPKLKSSFIKILLPHSLHKQTTDVCLFVKDLDKNNRDYSPTVDHFTDILHNHRVSTISEVIPLKGLKVEYQPFEAKKNLSELYEVFLADERIVRLLPTLLGKHFYGKKRYPVPLNLDAKDLKSEIKKALSVTQCTVGGHGNTCSVSVAHTGLETEAASENILAAISKLSESVPGGWNNLKSLHLKLTGSPALPIHLDLGSPNEVTINQRRPRPVLDEPEEVSTIEHGKVRVTPHGHVQIINDCTQGFYSKTGQLRKHAKRILAKQKQERRQQRGSKGGKRRKRAGTGGEGDGGVDEEGEGEDKEEGAGDGEKQARGRRPQGTEETKSKKTEGTKKGKSAEEVKQGKEAVAKREVTRRGRSAQATKPGKSMEETKQAKKSEGTKRGKSVEVTKQDNTTKVTKRGRSTEVTQAGKSPKVTRQGKKSEVTKGGQGTDMKKRGQSAEATKVGTESEVTQRGRRKRKVSEEVDDQKSEEVRDKKSVKRKSPGKSMERDVKKSRKVGAGRPTKKVLKK